MRWPRHLSLLCVWIAAAVAPPCPADDRPTGPDLREAVVFKLLMFVDWPVNMQREGADPFHLCVLDDGSRRPTMASLDGRRLGDRTLTLLRVDRDPGSLRKCHAIFIDAGNRGSLAGIAAGTRHAPVLIIAEGDQAIQGGATIALSTAGGRIVFDVDLAAARVASLSISSKLLRIARSVFE